MSEETTELMEQEKANPNENFTTDVTVRVATLRERIAMFVIRADEGRRVADELAQSAAVCRKFIEQYYAPLKKAADAEHKKLCDEERSWLGPVLELETHVKNQIAQWDLAQKRAHEEAMRAAQAEAERKALEEREQEIRQLEELGGAIEEVASVCERPIIPVVVLPAAPVTSYRTSVRQKYRGEVTDFAALVRHVAANIGLIGLLQVNESAVNKFVGAHNGAVSLPGITIIEVPVTTTRTK